MASSSSRGMTLREFAAKVRRMGKTVEDNGGNLLRRTAMALDRRLVKQTPVDTGLARSNWLAAVNRDRTKPGPILNPQAAIAATKIAIAGAKAGDTIYISNNLPYINALNAGKSPKAPAGFVDMIVIAVAARIGKNVDITKENIGGLSDEELL